MGTKTDSKTSIVSKSDFKTEKLISDYDLFLLGEGTHYKSFEIFGSKLKEINGVKGVLFTVWAPAAKSVAVIGEFNNWKENSDYLDKIDNYSGIWQTFIPNLKEGALYKYSVEFQDGRVEHKSDPYAYKTELRPRTASVVEALDKFKWNDEKWLKQREEKNFSNEPISILEVHLGSWKRKEGNEFLSYEELAHDIAAYAKDMGYTHIELLPVMEHPLDASWGYQTISYYSPTARFGAPEDFQYFVDHMHQNDLGVILDWVPSHFPKDLHGLNQFDGTSLYSYEDWRRGEHKEWGTLVFDYFRPQVRNFLISNALFWIDKYHIDGLRVDAVASMLYLDYSREEGEWAQNCFGGREHLEAIDFIKKFNEVIHQKHRGVLTIAEESTAWTGVSKPTYLGGLGFDIKWNMGWMHDSLEYISKEPIHRQFHQDSLTFSLIYAFSENFVLPFSHDEVVHGKGNMLNKMPGDDWQKFANLRLLMAYMFTHPGKKLLFQGIDFGQWDEWNFDQSLDWHLKGFDRHACLNNCVRDLNNIYRSHPALYQTDFNDKGFEWIDFSDGASSVVSYLRWSEDYSQLILVVANMTPVARTNYRLGAPREGYYKEIFNSDAKEYWGSGVGNDGGKHSQNISQHGRPYSLELDLPPLAVNVFRFEG